MKLYVNPSISKLTKIIKNEYRKDNTILHYTGHMFGIGCSIESDVTIAKIVELKKRDNKQGFIVLFPNISWFERYNIQIPTELQHILDQYWPGNLTVVLDCELEMFSSIAVNGKVAFRVPNDFLLNSVISLLDSPLISTSINYTNLPAEHDINRILKHFGSWFDLGFIPSDKDILASPEPSTIVEFNNKPVPQLKCLREGSIPFYEVKQAFIKPTVMFVCTGNICRSPIAEYLFAEYTKQKNLNFTSDSSGLLDGSNMISLNSLQLLLANGINAQEHFSKKIDAQMMSNSWIILTMEERQRNFLRQNFPNTAHKVWTLNEIVGESGDIEDPYRADMDTYKETYDIIDDRVRRLVDMIQNNSLKLGNEMI